jgi:ArsR family transcriptional regulator, lead/cadmium/zinc/bismuth-responsive transcriptional repressor
MKQSAKPVEQRPACSHPGHARRPAEPAALDRAARLFRAMGDGHRLRILQYLRAGECCVTELVRDLGEKFPTISQRLRVLRTEGLVAGRRVGLHVYYTLADQHVTDLLENALAHAGELNGPKTRSGRGAPATEEEEE